MRRVLAAALLAAATAAAAPAAQADTGPGWPASCVRDHTTLNPPSVEGYWLITCIAPIIP